MLTLTRNQFDVLVVLLSWTLGFLPLFVQRLRGRQARLTWVQCVGLGLVLSPLVRVALNISLTVGSLFVFTVLEPVSRAAMWRSIARELLFDLAIPMLGLLLLHNAIPGMLSRRASRGSVPEMLETHGLAPRHSWGRDALRGFTLFFCIALAYAAVFALASLFSPQQAGGDESRYWVNITIPLIVLVSGVAGLTEEFLFRGVVLSRLARWMPIGFAAVVQAIFFAFAHSGYGTWLHVAGPAAFGLGMAWIARTLGIVPAILLHLQVNVVFFAFDIADVVPAAWWLLLVLGVINVFAALVTRFDAVVILWRSLVQGVRRPLQLLERDGDAPGAIEN